MLVDLIIVYGALADPSMVDAAGQFQTVHARFLAAGESTGLRNDSRNESETNCSLMFMRESGEQRQFGNITS